MLVNLNDMQKISLRDVLKKSQICVRKIKISNITNFWQYFQILMFIHFLMHADF